MDTLGGAVEAAERLPDGLGSAVIDTARDAFILGLQIASMVGIAVSLATALVVVVLLRRLEAQPTD